MRYYFISLLLMFSATSYAQYECGEEVGLTDAPFGPHKFVLIKANHPAEGFGVYRLHNGSADNIIVDGYYDRESAADSDKNYYLHPPSLPNNHLSFWRLKIKKPNKGWHYLSDESPLGVAQVPYDELIIESGNYVDLIGKLPHDKEEYIEETHSKYKDYLYQPDYQDYAYRIEYFNRKGYFLLSHPYCLRP